MTAPINEFVKKYAQNKTIRFHMPGHKGRIFHGLEPLDITEISGADYLFEPDGIIKDSENTMSKAFNTAKTLYSTEGSSLCIKTMLGLIKYKKGQPDKQPVIIAPRNCHKAFINACALLDLDVKWVYPAKKSSSICSSEITPDDIKKALIACNDTADAVYLTSPDYLGNMCDIKAISAVCKAHNAILITDNAHGAYLNFLPENLHPIALGADMCCDSAHKTLPCYTGGALLHISKNAPAVLAENAKLIMSMFASTSPSYLIMQSLDLCAEYVTGNFSNDLLRTVESTALCRKSLSENGWNVSAEQNTEPMKITVDANTSGLTGEQLADRLREFNIEPEYSDCRYCVLMPSVCNSEEDFSALESAMSKIPQPKILIPPNVTEIPQAKVRMSIREATFSLSHTIPVDEAEGKICGLTVTGCQPSVPIAVSGEEITSEVIKILKKYSIFHINVL
ncbi:MAG: aminotransferase class I/II-fold pyridoxal phosphate-dependent enzyme [Hominimerdicola sp.]